MRANLDRDGGLLMAESLTMALAPHLGARRATPGRATGQRALAAQTRLQQAALADAQVRAHLSPDQIAPGARSRRLSGQRRYLY